MVENLEEVLFGGQSFSWRKEDMCYAAVLNDRVYRIKTAEDFYQDEFLSSYFNTSYDWEAAGREIRNKDEILRRAVDEVGMLRILKQDPFTTLISFILSQANNIKRITGLYERISRRYGKRIDENHYTFPTLEEMKDATESDLIGLGTGFRAPFIVDAIKHADALDSLYSMSFEEAEKELMKIKGIGEKVASCILIFAYNKMEAFPIDVWMKRVMNEYYPGKDKSYFAPYEALSQQYLFSWIRKIS